MPDRPDIEWYSRVSREHGTAVHCPFATVETCPRYFESLSLTVDTGASGIPQKENDRLLKKWQKHDLWPRTGEQASSVFKANDRLSFISNFCPEVTYERFGLFCSSLHDYSDGIDKDAAHRSLARDKVPQNDIRWQWAHGEAQHYSACPRYAVLHHRALTEKKAEPWWREHLAKIITGVILALAGGLVGHFLK